MGTFANGFHCYVSLPPHQKQWPTSCRLRGKGGSARVPSKREGRTKRGRTKKERRGKGAETKTTKMHEKMAG